MRRQCNSGGICVISLHQFGFRLLWLRRSPGDWLGAMAVTCTHLWTRSLSGSCSASRCPWRHDQREVGGWVSGWRRRAPTIDRCDGDWRSCMTSMEAATAMFVDDCYPVAHVARRIVRGRPYGNVGGICCYPLRSLHARGHNIALVYARFIVITTIIHEKLLMRGLYVTAVVWRHVTCFIIKVYLSLNWHHDVT